MFRFRSVFNKLSNSVWFNLGLFSFLLNFVWEMAQIPFFLTMLEKSHLNGVLICALATLGDVLISYTGYSLGIIQSRDDLWILSKKPLATWLYLACGVILTIIFEHVATGPFQLWEYSPLMPILPILGTGLTPLLQWLILPLPILWLARRQIQGAHSGDSLP